jgi:hypothetical protein
MLMLQMIVVNFVQMQLLLRLKQIVQRLVVVGLMVYVMVETGVNILVVIQITLHPIRVQ